MSRDLIDVVKAMIEVVPQIEKSVLSSLDDFRSTVEYAAPEKMPSLWDRIARFLQEVFPDPTNLEDWQQAVIDIWTDMDSEVGSKTITQVLRDYSNGMSYGEITDRYPPLTFEQVFAITAGGERLTIKEIEARLPNVRVGMAGMDILLVMRQSEETDK